MIALVKLILAGLRTLLNLLIGSKDNVIVSTLDVALDIATNIVCDIVQIIDNGNKIETIA